MESQKTEILINKNSTQAIGMIISGIIWPYINQYLSNKKCMILTSLMQTLCIFLFGLISDAYFIPIIFLFKGITFGIYSVGIATIYDFCPKDYLKMQFTLIILVSMFIVKSVGSLGSFMYRYFDNSFFIVNTIIAANMIACIVIYIIFYEDTNIDKD